MVTAAIAIANYFNMLNEQLLDTVLHITFNTALQIQDSKSKVY